MDEARIVQQLLASFRAVEHLTAEQLQGLLLSTLTATIIDQQDQQGNSCGRSGASSGVMAHPAHARVISSEQAEEDKAVLTVGPCAICVVVGSLLQLPAALQLGEQQLFELLVTAIQARQERAVKLLVQLPGAGRLDRERVCDLISLDLQHGTSGAVEVLVQLAGAQHIPPQVVAEQLVVLALGNDREMALGWLLGLEGTRQMSRKYRMGVLEVAVVAAKGVPLLLHELVGDSLSKGEMGRLLRAALTREEHCSVCVLVDAAAAAISKLGGEELKEVLKVPIELGQAYVVKQMLKDARGGVLSAAALGELLADVVCSGKASLFSVLVKCVLPAAKYGCQDLEVLLRSCAVRGVGCKELAAGGSCPSCALLTVFCNCPHDQKFSLQEKMCILGAAADHRAAYADALSLISAVVCDAAAHGAAIISKILQGPALTKVELLHLRTLLQQKSVQKLSPVEVKDLLLEALQSGRQQPVLECLLVKLSNVVKQLPSAAAKELLSCAAARADEAAVKVLVQRVPSAKELTSAQVCDLILATRAGVAGGGGGGRDAAAAVRSAVQLLQLLGADLNAISLEDRERVLPVLVRSAGAMTPGVGTCRLASASR